MDLALQKVQLELKNLVARNTGELTAAVAELQVLVEHLQVVVARIDARLTALERKPNVTLHHHSGGAGGNTTVVNFDINSLPAGDPAVVPEEVIVKQQNQWRRMTWAAFVDLLPSGGTTPDLYADDYATKYS